MTASPNRIESEGVADAAESARRSAGFPQRIVCLTDETTETLYLLGEQDRIVGVSAYAVRPAEARNKPRVSAFK
ncbi:MAG: ABC transporter substrate-binding protein, partial [Terracidiphilus sp.]